MKKLGSGAFADVFRVKRKMKPGENMSTQLITRNDFALKVRRILFFTSPPSLTSFLSPVCVPFLSFPSLSWLVLSVRNFSSCSCASFSFFFC
jgi:hypothetical protein